MKKLDEKSEEIETLRMLTLRMNALSYAQRKIEHDHVQILIWIANTRKRLIDTEVFLNGDDYEPVKFTDNCPRITLQPKEKTAATGRGKKGLKSVT